MPRKPFINRDNPALNFISTAGREAPEPETRPEPKPEPEKKEQGKHGSKLEPPEGYKLNPQFIEKRTRRLQLVLQPSLYEKVRARAQESGISVNEYIHSVLEEAIEKER